MASEGIQSVCTSFNLLEFLAEAGESGVTEIASAIDVPKSTVHTHLQTLGQNGYVIKEGDRYRIGFRMLGPGIKARSRHSLYRVARPEMNELAQDTGEVSGLLIEENGLGVFLYRARGDRAARLNTHTGKCIHLHTTALGKAILAHLSREQVEGIIDQHGLPQRTENTISEKGQLFEELTEIREEGVAFDDGELMPRLRCVAAPIRTDEGEVVGAISLAAPEFRMPEQKFRETAPDLVKSVTNVVELNMIHTPE